MMNSPHDRPDDSQRIDLGALNPDASAMSADHFASAVLARIRTAGVAPEIPLDPLYGLWSIPPAFLVAASILVVAAVAIPARPARSVSTPPATVAEAVGALTSTPSTTAPQP